MRPGKARLEKELVFHNQIGGGLLTRIRGRSRKVGSDLRPGRAVRCDSAPEDWRKMQTWRGNSSVGQKGSKGVTARICGRHECALQLTGSWRENRLWLLRLDMFRECPCSSCK